MIRRPPRSTRTDTLSLHDALPIYPTLSIERLDTPAAKPQLSAAEMSARLAELPNMIANASSFFVDHVVGLRRDRSEEHTSELQSLMRISYAVFCLKKKI